MTNPKVWTKNSAKGLVSKGNSRARKPKEGSKTLELLPEEE
jgi:hypothetical protein